MAVKSPPVGKQSAFPALSPALSEPGPANLWRQWLRRRLPPADQISLGRRNLFILPTREGALFLVLLVIMLLTGINYQNSLVYLLTFLLGALFYVGMLQTHDNLSGTTVSLGRLEEGFVGATLAIELRLTAHDRRSRPALSFFLDDTDIQVHLKGDDSTAATLAYVPVNRGRQSLPRIRIETRYPLGLFRAWSYLWLESPLLAYPWPLEPPASHQSGWGSNDTPPQSAGRASGDDFLLRPYREGDLLQRMQWKRYARDQQMVVLDPEPIASDPLWLDFDAFPGVDDELRLSWLAWQVNACGDQGQPFGLRLPGSELAPDVGKTQVRQALRRLALFPGRGNA